MGTTLFACLSSAPRLARRALSFGLAAGVAGALAACGDDNTFLSPATSENAIKSYSVWAITGTSAALPAAVQFSAQTTERPQILANGSVNFEIAFDITGDGKVRFMPARSFVPQPPSGAPTVGLTKSTSAFSAITRAPDRGYTDDSTLVVSTNEVVLVRLSGSGCIYGEPYYAKAIVDSVIAAERRIVLRALVNRNCGYRALSEGLPSN